MSVYVQKEDGTTLWNPASSIARLFLSEVRAVEQALGVKSGISDIEADEITVDLPQLVTFAQSGSDRGHPVGALLRRPVHIVATALLLRANVPPVDVPGDLLTEATALLNWMAT